MVFTFADGRQVACRVRSVMFSGIAARTMSGLERDGCVARAIFRFEPPLSMGDPVGHLRGLHVRCTYVSPGRWSIYDPRVAADWEVPERWLKESGGD